VVQTCPELGSFSEGGTTPSQTSYHNADFGQCHLRRLLDGKPDFLSYRVLE